MFTPLYGSEQQIIIYKVCLGELFLIGTARTIKFNHV